MLKFLDTVKNLAEMKNLSESFYSHYKLDAKSRSLMNDWMKYNKIESPVPPDELHCTLIYSKIDPSDYSPSNTPIEIDLSTATFGHLGPDESKRATVILLPHVTGLSQRYNLVKSKGAVSDFPKYIPHITLSYSAFDYTVLTQPTFTITLEREYIKYTS
jgi:hypothetical protein